MFGGLARRRGLRDAAVVALWLALVVGFVVQVTPAAPRAPAEPVFATASDPAGPPARTTERTARPVVLVETVRYP
jgi:hypothetical protein